MILAIIFIAILCLAGFLLFVPLRIYLKYERHDKKQDFEVILYIWKIPIRIPIKTEPEREKRKPKKQKPEPKKRMGFEEFKESVSDFVQHYYESKEQLTDSLLYLKRHTECSRFRFQLQFGTSNAARTGIFTGAAWTTGTLILRILHQILDIKKIEMNVYPDFNKQRLDVHISCILRVQTVHIINVGIRLFKIFQVFTQKKVVP